MLLLFFCSIFYVILFYFLLVISCSDIQRAKKLLIVDIELGLMKHPVVPIGNWLFCTCYTLECRFRLKGPKILIVCVTNCFSGLIGLTRSLYAEFYFLNFFNAESRGKRPLDPLVTITPERKRQKRDIPESKASFVAYKVENDLQECWSQYVFLNFTRLKYSFDEAWCFNSPAIGRKKFFLSGDF